MTQAPPIVSEATRQALELPALLALIAELAATDVGSERIVALVPSAGSAELASRHAAFEEAGSLLLEGPLVSSFDAPIGALLELLAEDRLAITGADLLRLAAVLRLAREACERIRGADPELPQLARRARLAPDLQPLERRIVRTLDRRGEVREDATPELAALRGQIRSLRGTLYEELQGLVTKHRDDLAEDTIPMRAGRLVLMLRSGSRGRVGGLVHGRSGTGRSFYFEPFAVVESNNHLQQALEDEEAEKARIIAELVGLARQSLVEIGAVFDLVADLDLLEACHRFARLCDGRLAEEAPAGTLELVGARHPLLDARLAGLRERALGQPGHQGEVVPLDLELSGQRRLLVVTGPNAGGKTVALKTLGLLALAAQCGLPVPVGRGTRLPLFRAVVATVGDEQDLLADRSTFSGRLLRLKEAWELAGAGSLILLDELGSGTDPEEGAALSVALLEGLLESGSLALITTHLTQVAATALERPGASCAAMEFDPHTGSPTFHLLPGPPGGSEALALARRLGLPAALLTRADELLGGDYRNLRRLLTEVERVRGELAATSARVARQERELAGRIEELEEERGRLESERREVGGRLRRELESFRRQVGERLQEESDRLRQQLEAGRRRGLEAEAVARLFAAAPHLVPPEPPPSGTLVVGGSVRHAQLGWTGVLERIDRGRAEVTVRGKRLRCAVGELAPLAGPLEVAASRGGVEVAMPPEESGTTVELNLIGRRVEPALEALDDYLDDALLAGLDEVRVIHGHGSGRLRDAVREHLRGHRAVTRFRPGAANEGGNGATVVDLKGS